MPLHDTFGINCKKGATTENEGTDVKYMGQRVYVDDCVCVCYLTLHDLNHDDIISVFLISNSRKY